MFGDRRRPAAEAAVMATYATAQALLVTALTDRPTTAQPTHGRASGLAGNARQPRPGAAPARCPRTGLLRCRERGGRGTGSALRTAQLRLASKASPSR
jgi:hypothetical protein